MRAYVLAGAMALTLCSASFAGGTTIADRCMAHVTKGAIQVFRDVDVLASGRERIAYFRCIRNGLRDDAATSAFAGLVPHLQPGMGGGANGFNGLNFGG